MFPTLPDEATIAFDFHSLEWSPPPFIRTDTIPPHWYWSSRTSIEASLPVAVASDAPSGAYRYAVRTFHESNPDSASTTNDFTITVTG
ncbi:hypothetical protein GCM10025298_22080 [Natronobiforma cellulositropha]